MTNKEVLVKICGLSTAETLETTITAGADLAGFVFFEKSPRHLDLETARLLNRCAQGRIKKVALVVDSDDEMLAAIIAALAPDILQLHGHETPARVMDIRKRFHLPIIKAVGVKTAADILAARVYRQAADILLLMRSLRPTRRFLAGLAFHLIGGSCMISLHNLGCCPAVLIATMSPAP